MLNLFDVKYTIIDNTYLHTCNTKKMVSEESSSLISRFLYLLFFVLFIYIRVCIVEQYIKQTSLQIFNLLSIKLLLIPNRILAKPNMSLKSFLRENIFNLLIIKSLPCMNNHLILVMYLYIHILKNVSLDGTLFNIIETKPNLTVPFMVSNLSKHFIGYLRDIYYTYNTHQFIPSKTKISTFYQ